MPCRRSCTWLGILLALATALLPGATPARTQSLHGPAGAGTVVFLSTQFTPADEAATYRSKILANAPIHADFLPSDSGPFYTRIQSEETAHHLTIGLIGGLHGDLEPLARQGYLQDMTPLLTREKKVGFPESLLSLSGFGAKKRHYYVPWMQATYIMAVNVKALKFLPASANVEHLTYDQLIQWGKNLQRGTGRKLIGLPAGPTGLLHRFLQGYLYPSFTHSSGVVEFRSAAAVSMWQTMKQLWAVTNPRSTGYSFMQDPLQSGEIWVAWDHVARLIAAVDRQPKQFRLVPAPSGPSGLGYMPVIAGLAIPRGAPDTRSSEQLITYLSQPAQQVSTLANLAFFPATNARLPASLRAGVRLEGLAVKAQARARNALPALLPVGLGEESTAFNNVYLDTFRRIILNREPIRAVLNSEAQTLQGILDQAKAPCWAPDKPSKGTCRVR